MRRIHHHEVNWPLQLGGMKETPLESYVCPQYDSETHVCKADGTAICLNPSAAFCQTRLEEYQAHGGQLP
jgi:hypothetical protein